MKHLGYQQDRSSLKIKTMLVAFFMLAIISALVILSVKQVENVFALENNNTAVKVGEGKALWDTKSSSFNYDVLYDLKEKLFGKDEGVSYIKSMTDVQTQANVVPASEINKRVGNEKEGLVVRLGGYLWSAASLTLADIGDKKDNVVLTLYLVEPYSQQNCQFNETYPVGDKRGDNVYSNSSIRNMYLRQNAWSLFSGGDFAEQYLVQPKYIKYQQNQTAFQRESGKTNHYINEALGEMSNNWTYDDEYLPDEIFGGKRYDDWGNDYIWIPSLTEVGTSNNLNTTCIWKLSEEQRRWTYSSSNFSNNYAWLRSGYTTTMSGRYKNIYTISCESRMVSQPVSSAYGIRPAIHLNLTAAGQDTIGNGVSFDENSDFEYIYKDSNNIRQSYATNGYEHNNNDKEIATTNGETRYILGVKNNTTIYTLLNSLKSDNILINICDNNGNDIYCGIIVAGFVPEYIGNQVIGTGWYIEFYDMFNKKKVIEKVYISVLGDVNGDGRISASDVMYIRAIANDKNLYDSLDTEVKLACMILNKGSVTSVDSEILLNIMSYKLTIDIFY